MTSSDDVVITCASMVCAVNFLTEYNAAIESVGTIISVVVILFSAYHKFKPKKNDRED